MSLIARKFVSTGSRMGKISHHFFFAKVLLARNSNKEKVHSSRNKKTERFKLTFFIAEFTKKAGRRVRQIEWI